MLGLYIGPRIGQEHVPGLVKILDVIWAQYELFGTALGVPSKKFGIMKSNPEASSCADKLLAVIKHLGTIPMAQRTWGKIHEAVMDLERYDIAGKIKEKYPNLGMCKLIFYMLCIIIHT